MPAEDVFRAPFPSAVRWDFRAQNTFFVCCVLFLGIELYYFLLLYRLYFAGLIGILAYLAYVSRSSGYRVAYTYPVILVACYGYLLLSTLWSPLESVGLYKISVESVYFLFALIPTLERVCGSDLKFRMLQSGSLAFCMAAIAAYVTVGNVVDPAKPSIRTLIGAAFLASIPAHVYLVSRRKSLLSFAALVAIGAIALGLENRTLLLFGPPVFLAAVFIAVRERLSDGRRFRQTLGIAIIVVPLLALLAGELYFSGVYSRLRTDTSLNVSREVLQEQFSEHSAGDLERRIYTFVSIGMFVDHPVWGAGYGSSPYYVHRVSQFTTVAHGLPFMLLAETGVIGTALFSIAIFWSFRGYAQKLRVTDDRDGKLRVRMELLSLCALLLVGLSHQIYDDIYFYMFLGTGLFYRFHFVSPRPVRVVNLDRDDPRARLAVSGL